MVAQKLHRSTSWEMLTEWQLGNTGTAEVRHYQEIVIPFVMDMLRPQIGERVLELNFNTSALAQHIISQHALYVGIDSEKQLVKAAQQEFGKYATFLEGDICKLQGMPEIEPGSFQAVVSMLSMHDVDSLEQAFESVSWALGIGGRFVMLLVHPYFHIPFQSGWSWDQIRNRYQRRVDRYMTPVAMPHPERKGYSYHRPLPAYINAMVRQGIMIDGMNEISVGSGGLDRELLEAEYEFPMFMLLQGSKTFPGFY